MGKLDLKGLRGLIKLDKGICKRCKGEFRLKFSKEMTGKESWDIRWDHEDEAREIP